MARSRRTNQLEMNFDGLADSVTNLVGALILLVVLVIGLTKDAPLRAAPPSPEPSTGEGGEKPILPLQQRIAVLQTQVRQVDASIDDLNGRLQPLRQEIEELLEKLDRAQPPEKEAQEPPPREAKEIAFRPPFEQLKLGRKTVSFVVEEGRISFLDFEEVDRQLANALQGKSTVVSINVDLADSDFRLEGKASQDMLDLRLVRRPGSPGETWEAAARPDSQFRKKLAQLDPQNVDVDFAVYPDSFEQFRQLRQLVWDNKFDLGWSPQSAGEPIKLARGAAVSVTQ